MNNDLHYSSINFKIGLDENKVPKQIKWKADDAGMEDLEEAKAIMLSVFDPKKNETLRIDLWTNEMRVDEMKQFFHQTLLSMSDTLERATNEKKLTEEMRNFCKVFAEKM